MGANASTGMIVDSPSTVKPLYSAQVTDYLERNLANQLEQDALDDQFFLSVSPDGKHFATGGYNKSGHVIDLNATTNTSISCKFDEQRDKPVGGLKVYGKNKRLIAGSQNTTATKSNSNSSALDKQIDLRKRVSMGAWKP